jgi:hypothetical protein
MWQGKDETVNVETRALQYYEEHGFKGYAFLCGPSVKLNSCQIPLRDPGSDNTLRSPLLGDHFRASSGRFRDTLAAGALGSCGGFILLCAASSN